MTFKSGSWGNQAKQRHNKRLEQSYWKTYIRKLRADVIDKYGGRCERCGITDIRVLQIDHVFNDGAVERKTMFDNATKLYRFLRSSDKSDRYQVLCANCNWIKRFERGEV